MKFAASGLRQVQNESPAVLSNSGVWATHMGVSSNVRYQALNGLDMVSCKRQSLLNGDCVCTHRFAIESLTLQPRMHAECRCICTPFAIESLILQPQMDAGWQFD